MKPLAPMFGLGENGLHLRRYSGHLICSEFEDDTLRIEDVEHFRLCPDSAQRPSPCESEGRFPWPLQLYFNSGSEQAVMDGGQPGDVKTLDSEVQHCIAFRWSSAQTVRMTQ